MFQGLRRKGWDDGANIGLFAMASVSLFGLLPPAGCGPIDPVWYADVYKPAEGIDGCEIEVVTENYDGWGRTHCVGRPTVRVREESGRYWELILRGEEPNTWELWTWMAGEARERVPLKRASRTQR